MPYSNDGIDSAFGNDDQYESIDSDRSWMERIADALEENLGIDLGDFQHCDANCFARIVEAATKHYRQGKDEAKVAMAAKAAKAKRKVQMSLRNRQGRPTDDQIVSAFTRTVGNDGREDDLVNAFLRHANSN